MKGFLERLLVIVQIVVGIVAFLLICVLWVTTMICDTLLIPIYCFIWLIMGKNLFRIITTNIEEFLNLDKL